MKGLPPLTGVLTWWTARSTKGPFDGHPLDLVSSVWKYAFLYTECHCVKFQLQQ